jgi:prepilin-type N-terminal cleavage/methylation domain-containing protein
VTRQRKHEGFTLVELMVALVAGVIAISTVYFVGASSSRHFHEQQRVAQTQMGLRMAMEQMRHDIQRAGFLGVPNSLTAQQCGFPPAQAVQAVMFQDNVDTQFLPNAGENGVQADSLVLTGNYATGDSYLAQGLGAAGNEMFLQTEWQNVRRDFGEGGQQILPPVQVNPDRLAAAFRPGRLLHITSQQGNHFFMPIAGAQGGTGRATVRLVGALPPGGTCVVGLLAGAEVAPISRIRYQVIGMDGAFQALLPADGQVAGPQDPRGLTNALLVREEIGGVGNVLNDGNGAPLRRVVLEYVANLDFRFVLNTALPGMPPQIVTGGGENPVVVGALADLNTSPAATPHMVRSVIVTLSARTAEQDPRFPWDPTGAGNPLLGIAPTRYRANQSLPGASRVRTLRTEIFLPNLIPR